MWLVSERHGDGLGKRDLSRKEKRGFFFWSYGGILRVELEKKNQRVKLASEERF